MENLWTNINDDIPMYMSGLCEEHNLKCKRISPIKTAIIGNKFALIIAIDRFDIEIYYSCKKGENIVKYPCGSFFAQAYDIKDRENLSGGEGADAYVRNCILVAARGLNSKWNSVLDGDTKWFEKYKVSSRYSIEKLTDEEEALLAKELI